MNTKFSLSLFALTLLLLILGIYIIDSRKTNQNQKTENSDKSYTGITIEPPDTNSNLKTERRINNSKIIDLKHSTALEELEKYFKDNPQISAEDLADLGNTLLKQKGFNYDISFCDVIEKKIKTKEAKEVPGVYENDPYVTFPFRVSMINSTQKTFQIVAPTIESCCCGYCYTEFPVSKITDKQIGIVSDGKTYFVKRTKDLSVSQENILVDNKTLRKEIRKWEVPDEGAPYGISEDGSKLYIENLIEPNIILLEIADNGDLKLVSKNHPNIISNGVDLREAPQPKVGEILYKSGEFGYMLFKSAKREFIVKFFYICT